MIRRLKKYSSDVDWIEEHRDELRREHLNTFIAVRDRRVLFTAPTMIDLVKLIDEAGSSAEDCAVDFISAYDDLLLLETP
ncbi:MAG: hypothetical protein NTV61_00095 [Candidatus Bathyarchaeota archaeon]|nr:hypothetical protein [Candidatus Bathyarchaeota archaeon]